MTLTFNMLIYTKYATAILLALFSRSLVPQTNPIKRIFYHNETPYTIKTDTMKRLEKIPELTNQKLQLQYIVFLIKHTKKT